MKTSRFFSGTLCLAMAALLGLTLVIVGCRQPNPVPAPENAGEPWFKDVSAELGLDFVHDAGPEDERFFMPQIMGSGSALFDFDGDGRLDILLLNNGGHNGRPNQLFKQMQDGTFKNVSAGSGLDIAGHGMGVAVGDVDNDGNPDVYLTQYGGDLLFLNQGQGHFREATKESGLENSLWGTSVAFVDFDRDGWLDLVVVNYVNLDPHHACNAAAGKRDYCHPNSFPGTVTRLFRNRGRDASGKWLGFEDRTLAAGFAAHPGPGLGILCADFNGDGWPDIFVANDAKPNSLWINQKNGTFKEEAIDRGVAYNALGQAQGNMGVAYGDVSGDGMADLFVTHLVSEYPSLWKQGPRGRFQERTAESGLTRSDWRGTGFGTILADFDHDGALDLAVANGGVRRAFPRSGSYWEPYAERNQLFANDGKGVFRDLSKTNPAFCGWAGVSRGLAVGDVDGDGALDLLVTQIGGNARLFRNIVPNRGHWLMIRALVGIAPRDAIGAEIQVRAGTHRWSRLIQPSHSYLCSNDPRAHFGLGSIDRVDEILVIWPDGSQESFAGGGVDRLLAVRQGQGHILQPPK